MQYTRVEMNLYCNYRIIHFNEAQRVRV